MKEKNTQSGEKKSSKLKKKRQEKTLKIKNPITKPPQAV